MKKVSVSILITALLVLAGCGTTVGGGSADVDESADVSEPAVGDETNFNATVIEVSGNTAVVEPLEDGYGDRVTFSTDDLADIDAAVGDVVTITYIGDLAESYPVQINAVSWSIFEKGDSSTPAPAGMSPVETIQYFYQKMNEKDQAALESVYYDKYTENMYWGFDELISIELVSCEELTDTEFIETFYSEAWYENPYDIAIVNVTYDVKYEGGIGPAEYDGVYETNYTLVKADEYSDWMIVMAGLT